MTSEEQLALTLAKMRADWNERARENARHYVATGQTEWSDAEFFSSGEQVVGEQILTDMENICGRKKPGEMRVIEIGCGAGRITRALGRLFGEVHAVDVSEEMVKQANEATADLPHVHVYQNNGMDLSVLPPGTYDFAFSYIVFQHIPSREVIETYVRELARLLGRGRLFKFQLQGYETETRPEDTWVGVGFSEEQAREMAERNGFEMRYAHGAGTQEFWLWYFRKSRWRVFASAVNKLLSKPVFG